jgi:hypothetical protein
MLLYPSSQSWNLARSKSITPNQNDGIEMASNASVEASASTSRPRRVAASTPSGRLIAGAVLVADIVHIFGARIEGYQRRHQVAR